jgi:hypothetical protein
MGVLAERKHKLESKILRLTSQINEVQRKANAIE